jgi:hypothetical protein
LTRNRYLEQIQQRIGRRKLVWFGTRGDDARPLLAIPQFAEVFSIIAPLGALSISNEVSLETLKARRVDLDSYRLDDDESDEAGCLRRLLYESLGEPAVVVPYRPLSFFSSIYYPRIDLVEYLGLFQERQAPFEHKPWVESELKKLGIEVLPWRYFADNDLLRLNEVAEAGPLVLRSNRSDGGAGLALVTGRQELESRWPTHKDGFLAAAPLLEPNIPLNVNACVFEGGTVTLHGPSLQLISLDGYTRRRFGFCGNDFGRIGELDPEILDAFEVLVLTVGRWLAGKGYLGAFGVDAMIYEGRLLLTEINPRFQGSSAISARLDEALDDSDLFLAHMASFLGLPPPETRRLRDVAREQPAYSQVIAHNCIAEPVLVDAAHDAAEMHYECELLPQPATLVNPDAILLRVLVRESVTTDGQRLCEPYSGQIERLVESLYPAKPLIENAIDGGKA